MLLKMYALYKSLNMNNKQFLLTITHEKRTHSKIVWNSERTL